MDSEFQFHRETAVAAYIEQGLSPEEAEARARRDFGPIELPKEECHDQRPLEPLLQTALQDTRDALRGMVRQPGAAVVPPYLDDLRRYAASFKTMAGISPSWELTLTGLGEHAIVRSAFVSSGICKTFGIRTIAGREFSLAEQQPGGEPVATVTKGFWRRLFGPAASLSGQSIPPTAVNIASPASPPRRRLARRRGRNLVAIRPKSVCQ